jgi:hypothetical protein
MENAAEFFYEQLSTTTNPALVLSRFYGEVFDRQYGRSEVIMFNRLLKLYSKFTIYFSILDMTSMDNINFESGTFGLLSYFCKKRLEQKIGESTYNNLIDLEKEITKLEKLIEKQKTTKLKVRPLNEE